MPATNTERQKAFAAEFARNGGNATAAAKAAGYSERSAHEIGRQNLQSEVVQKLIRAEFLKLRGRSGAVGLNALVGICEDVKAPANARVAAARALLEHAGLIGAGRAAEEASAEDPVREGALMTPREVLQQFMRLDAGSAVRRQ